jgi:hypothetical protein
MNSFQEIDAATMQHIEGGGALIAAIVVGAVIVGAGVVAYKLGESSGKENCLTK